MTNIQDGHMATDEPQSNNLPLELQALIRGQRTSAIIMAIISILTIYLIPWAVFYIILATNLSPKRLPNRNLIKTAAIATLPLCLGLIPIIIDMEFWRMNRKLKEYEQLGSKAFISDKEYQAGEPKRKRGRIIAWSILVAIVAIFASLITIAVIYGTYRNTDSSSFLNSEVPTPYTSSEHGFVVSFPGFPTTEHSTTDIDGVPVPYTFYSTENKAGDVSYAVQIAKYPPSDINLVGQERGSLDGSINGMAQSTKATILSSSNNETFMGYPSAEASFNFNQDGQVYEMHTVNFIKGNDMYILMTVGGSKPDFDAFVNSFSFR